MNHYCKSTKLWSEEKEEFKRKTPQQIMLSLHWHRNRSMLNESRITEPVFAWLVFPCRVGLEPDRCFQVEVDQRAAQCFWSTATRRSTWIKQHAPTTRHLTQKDCSPGLPRPHGSIINSKCWSASAACAGWRLKHCEQSDWFPCVRKY